MKNVIYFDNNGTTPQSKQSIKETIKWMEVCANPSSNNKISLEAKKLIEEGKKYILNHCGVNSKKYTVIFTSGGTESNSFIIRSSVSSYIKIKKHKPHIIISSIEHNSIIDCCNKLVENDCIELTKVVPNIFGIIDPISIVKNIKSNTCLISIMFSNNEIGSINDIKQIGKIAHLNNIPFHTDAVQTFGKHVINLQKNNIDAISVSFHKFYSPKGIGLVIINNDFIDGYKLEGIINGTQQNGLRGGTENISSIAGAIVGMKYNFNKRNEKNKRLLKFRNVLLDNLNKYIDIIYYSDYYNKIEDYKDIDIFIILFGPYRKDISNYVENTLLISIVSNKKKLCNLILKKHLEEKNIIVSIGSACSTSSKYASHVLTELNISDIIKRGTIRISFGDNNNISEINTFIPILIKCINKQVPLINFIKKYKNKNIK